MPIRVPLRFANASMRLAHPVCDADGKVVAGGGTGLAAPVLRTLRALAVQTVLVADGADVASWEEARPLEDELDRLTARLAREAPSTALRALRDAITRHLHRRAARLAATAPERGDAAADDDAPPARPAARPAVGTVAPPTRRGVSAAASEFAPQRAARELVVDTQALRRRLRRLRSLPTLPRLVERVIGALDDPEVCFDSVAELIEVDQALTAQILRLANSAFFSAEGTVSRVTQALVMLGIVVSRSVIVSSGVLDIRAVRLRGFWEHSLGCAVAAGALGKVLGVASPEEVTTAGLLHDLGKVALYTELPAVFEHVVASAAADGRTFRDVEHAVLGMDHADVVATLVERWHFPPCLADPMIFHHRPAHARIAPRETAIVHVADILVRALGYGSGGDRRVGAVDPVAWERLALTAADLDAVLDRFDADLDHALNFALYA